MVCCPGLFVYSTQPTTATTGRGHLKAPAPPDSHITDRRSAGRLAGWQCAGGAAIAAEFLVAAASTMTPPL